MNKIHLYNTLSHSLEEFKPIEAPKVSMYNCGPTVYDFAHIGNFRAFVFADVLRRFLEVAGYNVHQVMNITDVGHMTEDAIADGGGEDKMAVAVEKMKQAKKSGKVEKGAVEDPSDPYQVAQFYTKAFIEDAKALNLKVASEPNNLPKATNHIDNMLAMIDKLIENGSAYVAKDGAVYFSVQTMADYGKLSGNTLDKIRGGAGGRVLDEHQADKKHPADFLLWKPDQSHVMKWDSKYGKGYPGWHIECSAMALALLGKPQIDIHTGGEDNIFPHHECEIAQSRSATGKDTFANYWLHTRFLMVEGKKMSKSSGNFYTVRQLMQKGIDPAVIRFELIKGHYRSNANFTLKGLEDAGSGVQKVRDTVAALQKETDSGADARPTDFSNSQVDLTNPVVEKAMNALADDLNVAGAIGVLFEYLPKAHKNPKEGLAVIKFLDKIFAILPDKTGKDDVDDNEKINVKCKELDMARQNKEYEKADKIRAQLIELGYEVKTTSEGTTARKKLA